MLVFIQRVLPLLLASVFMVSSLAAHGDNILVYGTASKLRADLEDSLKDALPAHTVFASDEVQERLDLAVVVGVTALKKFCSQDRTTPAIVTHIYELRMGEASAQCKQPIGAVYFDAPFQAQMDLAKALFPGNHSASLVPTNTHHDKALTRGIDLPVSLGDRSVYPAIKTLLKQRTDWSVFFVEMDPNVYEGTDYRLTIETLARHRKAAIVPVESLVKAGAVAGVYYTSESLETALLRAVRSFLSEGVSLKTRGKDLSVAINHSILRTLFGRKLSASEVEAIENGINER